MNCEEFEIIGLGSERESASQARENAADLAAAAREHANVCSRCAALQDSWRAAQCELSSLASLTKDAQAPPRTEMRLRQEFRTAKRTVQVRRSGAFAIWAVAAAAVLVATLSWRNWNIDTRIPTPNQIAVAPAQPDDSESTIATALQPELVAANDAGDFTLVPGSLPQEATDDAAIVRVRLQRGALATLGLPVNEERASEWIQVDLLVGADGQPQAVRLPQSQ
jgi:hypothetical protein